MSDAFLTTTHGALSCRGCHGGENSADIATAHTGMVASPSSPEWNGENLTFGVCDKCHAGEGELYANALHYTQQGYVTNLEAFTHEGILDSENPVSYAFDKNCSNCHADCGECHVTRPRTQNSGLLSGHMFQKEPPMKETCVGCHSTRNGAEYMGEVGPSADTHYYDYDMVCTDCHEVSNFHGNGELPADMHQATDMPQCIDCHADDMKASAGIEAHTAHDPQLLDCTVCHSQEANGCQNCHINYKDETKTSIASSSDPLKAFKIAKNPNPDELHPYTYVTVRHIPQTRDMLAGIGLAELENYDKIPNWQPSSTHNIVKYTPQNSECNACHGVAKLFLTEDDILPADSPASRDYVVDQIPEVIEDK